MKIDALKYLTPISVYLLAFLSFTHHGWFTWLPLIYAWVLIPLIELLIPPNASNLEAAEASLKKADRLYDWLLYLFVGIQVSALAFFVFVMKQDSLSGWDTAGRIGTMGLLCGTFGINVGHELGHRKNRWEQRLAKLSLMTSLYMHFFIEHNKGHHKHVATPQDPSSARYNEPIYLFFIRTITGGYQSAWKIADAETKQQGKSWFSLHNEMIQAHLIQVLLVVSIVSLAGPVVGLYFLIAALMGILLLETVNYIEHYGLQRQPTGDGRYERAMPNHSWNSNHLLGRLLLFELSRHSDHHYLASKKYQLLDDHPNAPQLPTGYPGTMLLSLVPPLWFYVMNQRIQSFQKNSATVQP